MAKTLHSAVSKCFACLGWCVLLAVCYSPLCQSYTDPVLQPIASNPDSAKNQADSNSTITWGDITQGMSYAGGEAYDDGGMGALFDMTRNFVNTALPNRFPYDIVVKVKNGALDIATIVKQIALDYAVGYTVCIAIGFLFMLIFPIVALCFCCCRCCGNCGGRKLQKNDPNTPCKRKVFGLMLLLITVITGVGMICGFVSNERMTVALDKFYSAADQLSNVETFLNNTVTQLNQVTIRNFDFVKSVVFRDLDSIDYLVGIPVKTKLGTDGRIIEALNSTKPLQKDIEEAVDQMKILNSSITQLKGNITQLEKELSSAKKSIDTCAPAFNNDTSALAVNINLTNLLDISSLMAKLNNLSTNNLTDNAWKNFNTIPQKIENETGTTKEDLKKMLNDFSNKTKMWSEMVDSFKSKALSPLVSINIKDYIKTAKDYSHYWWYGGVGLSCLVLLIVLLNLVGLGFGVFGSNVDTIPTDRGGLSNSGGNMLMAAVGFIFIFSPLLMLLTTVTFLVGAPLERFVCQPLKDPELSIFTKLIDEMSLLGKVNGSYLGNKILHDPSVNLSIGDILQDCKEGKSAWNAFKLNNSKMFNLSQLLDYKSSINISSQLEGIDSQVNFSSLNLLTPELSSQLADIKNATSGIDFAGFQTELDKNMTSGDLGAFIDNLTGYTRNQTEKTKLEEVIKNLTKTKNETMVNIQTAKEEVLNASLALNITISEVPGKVDILNRTLTLAQDYLQNNASSAIKTEAKALIDRILKTVDSYVNHTRDALYNDIGKCTPIYNIYNDLLLNGMCSYIIDALNTVWFTLGWCIFFFMPSLIFSVKLAKHYRTMKLMDDLESGKEPVDNSQPPMNSQGGPKIEKNKVIHSDK